AGGEPLGGTPFAEHRVDGIGSPARNRATPHRHTGRRARSFRLVGRLHMTRRRSAFATTFCFGILAAGTAAPQETKPAAVPAPAAAVDQQPTTPSGADTPAASAAEEEIL